MIDVIMDTLQDSLKLLPFLFLTYLLMEFAERRTGGKMTLAVRKAGKFGPFIGGVLGLFPQCGFSAAASDLYCGRIITLGTLLAIYLSTSDEMLPILISENVNFGIILKILAIKAIIGIVFGFLTDAMMHVLFKRRLSMEFSPFRPRDHHCDEEEGSIIKMAVLHTAQIFAFVLIISFVINFVMDYVGEEALKSVMSGYPVISEMITGLVGLIPNCAASVAITQLYLEGILPLGSMISGLLVSAGVGLIVLFKVNKDMKENLNIVALLYVTGVIGGCIVDLLGIKL